LLTTIDYILILLLGSFGGFLSGFLGVGGGIIYVPILDYFLSKMGLTDDALVKAILANSLFTIIFSGSVSSYKQYKLGNFFPKEIMHTAIPGVITAITMTLFIRMGTWYDKTIFNYVFAIMLFVIGVRMFMKTKEATHDTSISKKFLGFNITGFFAGIITAMSGLGGGVVMTPIFTDVLHQNIKKASSISNGVIPFFAISVGILNLSSNAAATQVHDWQIGFIVFPVVIPMIIGSIFFAPLGVTFSQKTSQKIIRNTFAFFITLVFIKTLYNILK
jgi:uncharacterized membrane protein YfcA